MSRNAAVHSRRKAQEGKEWLCPNFGHKDWSGPNSMENTNSRMNYAVKYATARGHQNPRSRTTKKKKTPRLHELFRRVRANFCLPPRDTSQEPGRNCSEKLVQINFWAAANGGVTNGGLRGVWPPFLEIGRNRPFSPFFCPFRPFPEGAKSTWEIQKTEEKGLFPQISSDLLKPPSLKPPFAALQNLLGGEFCSGGFPPVIPWVAFSTSSMTGRGFYRAMEMIPALLW